MLGVPPPSGLSVKAQPTCTGDVAKEEPQLFPEQLRNDLLSFLLLGRYSNEKLQFRTSDEHVHGRSRIIGPLLLAEIRADVSVLTTLERRFNLQSADVGVIASSFEIGNLALILFVSYFGAKAHRPRLIGCGGIIMALGALLSALPEFLTKQYEIGKMSRTEVGRDVCSNTSRADAQQAEDDVCNNRTNTNMMYLLLIGAQVLLGIGATPVQPLGVAYIDDHVKKKDSSLYIAPPWVESGFQWEVDGERLIEVGQSYGSRDSVLASSDKLRGELQERRAASSEEQCGIEPLS
ncbi:Solute carrier organic anion transporter family member 3A1 [Liparis tanakae]|uniref:Solute carrier organic anion transporter family member 3A1 n=1 Tax=Liparis tanakae TaxID=230148 RepID=A0A4Z2EXV7_9TELE|nr:Solute carrier organic anion transporter family member 3A1 [Liparis tanakae]